MLTSAYSSRRQTGSRPRRRPDRTRRSPQNVWRQECGTFIAIWTTFCLALGCFASHGAADETSAPRTVRPKNVGRLLDVGNRKNTGRPQDVAQNLGHANPRPPLDDFEGVQPSWHILHSSSLAAPAKVHRTDVAPHNGLRCEQISVLGVRGGEQILAARPLPPCAAIQELRIRLWLRGNRVGFQCMARVRLPRTLDEAGEPVSFYIYGDTYSAPQQWQQLSLANVERKVGDAVRALRIEMGQHVDPGEAYVDQVLLNTYGGAGLNQVWIDDLSVDAAIPVNVSRHVASIQQRPKQHVTLASHVTPATHQRDVDAQRNSPTRAATLPNDDWMTRAVTYHGESFQFLKRLGFNTIWLERTATPEQLDEARTLGLWMVCPPPDVAPFDPTTLRQFDRIVAWSLPTSESEMSSEERLELRTQIHELRRTDPRNRPVVSPISVRDVDDPRARTFDIELDRVPNPATVRRNWIGLGTPLVTTSRWLPLRTQAWNAVIAGYRGFALRSTVNLEKRSSTHAAHLAELLNLELTTLRPWIVETQTERVIDRDSNSHFDAAVLANPHTSLVLIQPASLRLETSDVAFPTHDIRIPTSAHREVFRLEPGGLSPVPPAAYHRVPGGIQIALDSGKPEGILVLTDRETVIQSLSHRLHNIWPRSRELLVAVMRDELLTLDNRIQHTVTDPTFKSNLRGELHALHSRIAPLLEDADGATFRHLDHVLRQLERAHVSISTK